METRLDTIVDAPVETVFTLASDVPNYDKHIRGITRVKLLTDGPIGVGTRFAETRLMFGREHTETMEITQFEPDRRFTLVANSCGCRYESAFDFAPVDHKTRLTFSFSATPLTFMARLMSPLGNLMAKSMRKMIQADLDDLRAACEQQPDVRA